MMRISFAVPLSLMTLTSILPAQRGQSSTARGPLSCALVAQASDSGNGRIGSVAPTNGGRLAWSDGVAGSFVVRDARGVLHRAGRSGEGPGEFRGVSSIGWLGDTVWVADYRLPRVQLFSETGKFLRTITAILPAGWIPRPDGYLVGMLNSAVARITYTVVAHQPGSMRIDTVVDFPVPRPEQVMIPTQGQSYANPHPLLPVTVANVASDGSRWCAAIPDKGGRFLLRCVDSHGRTLLDHSLSFPLREVTSAIYDSIVAIFAAAPGRTRQQMRDLISRPAFLPMVTGIQLDDFGDIWLGRQHSSESQARFVRLRADGTTRDSVTFPLSYHLSHIRGDSVWATTTNDDGIQSLNRCVIK